MDNVDWNKRARELAPDGLDGKRLRPLVYAAEHVRELALRLGREMADARAETIARNAEGHINAQDASHEARQACAHVARQIAWFARHEARPSTREEMLEKALRSIALSCQCSREDRHNREHFPYCPLRARHDALECPKDDH